MTLDLTAVPSSSTKVRSPATPRTSYSSATTAVRSKSASNRMMHRNASFATCPCNLTMEDQTNEKSTSQQSLQSHTDDTSEEANPSESPVTSETLTEAGASATSEGAGN